MTVLLSTIILMLEIFYYSIFMKTAREDGNFLRYITLFTIITIAGVFIGTGNTISYLLLIFAMLFGLKYIVRIKTTLFDCFIIIVMILFGVIVQLPCYLLLNNIINDLYIMMIIYQMIKLFVLLMLNDKISKFLTIVKGKWVRNNFYIRYIFSILLFLYVITTCIFIITLLL